MFVTLLHCGRFLKPVSHPTAHFSPALYFAKYTKIVQKKLKSSAAEPEPCSPPPAPLSPEQLDRIARNKKAALERLASAQTPPGFGESWREGLSAEFGKPYFKQVRAQIIHITLYAASVVMNSFNNLISLHSWWALSLKKGNATLCTHLLKMSSPGLRCATSEM